MTDKFIVVHRTTGKLVSARGIFEGTANDVYAWLKSKGQAFGPFEVFSEETKSFTSSEEFTRLHRAATVVQDRVHDDKLAKIAAIIMKAMQIQADAVYYSDTTDGLDLVAINAAKEIMKLQ